MVWNDAPESITHESTRLSKLQINASSNSSVAAFANSSSSHFLFLWVLFFFGALHWLVKWPLLSQFQQIMSLQNFVLLLVLSFDSILKRTCYVIWKHKKYSWNSACLIIENYVEHHWRLINLWVVMSYYCSHGLGTACLLLHQEYHDPKQHIHEQKGYLHTLKCNIFYFNEVYYNITMNTDFVCFTFQMEWW